MSYRFTNTDKWGDSWFNGLKPIEKLLFNYLCDKCDMAGFIEVIVKNWASDIGETESRIKEALKGVERGIVYSNDKETIYLRTFLRHQKNLPINLNNKSHVGIIRKFELYSYKFGFNDITDFITRGLEGASKGADSPTGIGIDILGKNSISIKTWKNDFKIYLDNCKDGFRAVLNDKASMDELQNFHPKLDIEKSMTKSFIGFWGTEAGWKNKKKAKIDNINWGTTIMNTLKNSAVYRDAK